MPKKKDTTQVEEQGQLNSGRRSVYEKYYVEKRDDSKKLVVAIKLLPAECSVCGEENCNGHYREVQVTGTGREKN